MKEQDLATYVREVLGGEDDMLRRLRQEATKKGIPEIQVPEELGRLLQCLIALGGVRKVLEIGTLSGYSAIMMARVLPPSGKVTTLEVNTEHAELARRNFEEAGVSDRVELIEGPALTSLSRLAGQSFDLVFIDADKRSYPEYLRHALSLFHPGSVLVADNVWRRGAAVSENDPDNAGVARFMREVGSNDRLLTTVLPRFGCTDAASVSIFR